MKRLVIVVLALLAMQTVWADDSAANVKLKLTGAKADNSYFVCLPNVGCLSVLAADRGTVYPVFHPIEINGIYITDVDHKFRLSGEGLPSSCNVTVKTGQTLTIYGQLVAGPNQSMDVNGLRCSVS